MRKNLWNIFYSTTKIMSNLFNNNHNDDEEEFVRFPHLPNEDDYEDEDDGDERVYDDEDYENGDEYVYDDMDEKYVLCNEQEVFFAGNYPIEMLPPNLKVLVNKFNDRITHTKNLPRDLKVLRFVNCRNMKNLDYLPVDLISLCCINVSHTILVDNLPLKLKFLQCDNAKITSIDHLPNNLKVLRCQDNKITSVDNLPKNLKKLICRKNKIRTVDSLPRNLKVFHCGDNLIRTVDNLPSDLKVFYCGHNLIKTLNSLPADLEELYCGDNLVKTLSNLPRNLEKLCCQNNNLIHLNNLPDTLVFLRCEGNPLLPSYELKYWKGVKRFRKFYFTTKYSSKLERIAIKIKNREKNEEILEIAFSPDYNFYKMLLEEETRKLLEGRYVYGNITSMFQDDINRDFPGYKEKFYGFSRKDFKEEDFDRILLLFGDTEFKDDYISWKSGINYRTKRKIKYGAGVWKNKQKFFMKEIVSKDMFALIGDFEWNNHLFDFERQFSEIKQMCIEEKISMLAIDEYNKNVSAVIYKINSLKGSKDFVEFEGVKYGKNIRIFMGNSEKETLRRRRKISKNGYEWRMVSTTTNKCGYVWRKRIAGVGWHVNGNGEWISAWTR